MSRQKEKCLLFENALTRALRRNLILALVLSLTAVLVSMAWSALLYAFAGVLLWVVISTCSQ